MNGLPWVLLGGLLVGGTFILAHYLRVFADDRAREARYADEWVRRHRQEAAND